MQKKKRRRTELLFLAALLFLCGCGTGKETVYEAGLAQLGETETGAAAAAEAFTGGREDENAAAQEADTQSTETGADAQEADTQSTETGAGAQEADTQSTGTGADAQNADMKNTETGADDAQDDSAGEPAGYVYVCGAVKTPGVYPLQEGMRVCEAIALAGGFAEGADEEWLNLAELVSDGERLYVYTLDETALQKEALAAQGISWQERDAAGAESKAAYGASRAGADSGTSSGTSQTAESGISSGTSGAAASGTESGAASADSRINLNTATKEELMTLPGIGEAKADAILSYREAHGAFQTTGELQNVSGIKNATYEKLRDLITV